MVGEPHGAELTGEGGRGRRRGRRREAEREQGAARPVQLHPDTCAGTSVLTWTQVRRLSLFQFIFKFIWFTDT